MKGRMDRLFRRAQPVKVITENGVFHRRGVIQPLGQGTKIDTLELTQYGSLSVPLYRYMGNAWELANCGEAVLVYGDMKFCVLNAKEIFGVSGCAYIEAVLERQVDEDDRQ